MNWGFVLLSWGKRKEENPKNARAIRIPNTQEVPLLSALLLLTPCADTLLLVLFCKLIVPRIDLAKNISTRRTFINYRKNGRQRRSIQIRNLLNRTPTSNINNYLHANFCSKSPEFPPFPLHNQLICNTWSYYISISIFITWRTLFMSCLDFTFSNLILDDLAIVIPSIFTTYSINLSLNHIFIR